MKTIGILGGTGSIGSRVIELLEDNYNIKASFHSQKKEKTGIQFVSVDIENKKEIEDFVDGCDIVINCAGASYLHSPLIASVVSEHEKTYIDPYGADFLFEKQQKLNKGCSFVSCGCFPGITGIMLKEVLAEMDTVEEIDGISYDRHTPSLFGTIDFILSAVHGFGKSGCCYRAGTLVKDDSISFFEDMDGYEGRASKYYTLEIDRLVQKYRPKSAIWYAPVLDPALTKYMQSGIMGYMQNSDVKSLKKTAGEICEFVRAHETSHTDCQIMIHATGYIGDKKSERKLMLRWENSSMISACVLAAMAEYAANNKTEPGTYWGMDLLNASDIVPWMNKSGMEFVSENTQIAEEEEYEQGVI